MSESRIVVRSAEMRDAEIIASAVAMAIGDTGTLKAYCGEQYHSVLQDIARQDDTQYSWRKALVAQVGNTVAGAIVGYDGALLATLREATFAVISHHTGFTPTVADETQAGEYYLDSVAVLPQFRGLGVGQRLITALCERAFAEGHDRVGLIVDCDNPKAERLYTSLGFRRVGTKTFFGHTMWHLQVERDYKTAQK